MRPSPISQSRTTAIKASRYFVVGGVSALIDWLIFSAFLYWADVHYLAAAAASFVCATSLNYLLSIKYVFNSGRHSRHAEITLVFLVSGVGVLVHLSIIALSVEFAGLHPLIGKVIATAAVFGWNFAARHLWIFER